MKLSVQGSLQCFVLRDEVDELDNSCSGFLACTLKLLATDVKNIENQSIFFFLVQTFWRQCVNMIDTI